MLWYGDLSHVNHLMDQWAAMQCVPMQCSQQCNHCTVGLWCNSWMQLCLSCVTSRLCLSTMARCIATHLFYLHYVYSYVCNLTLHRLKKEWLLLFKICDRTLHSQAPKLHFSWLKTIAVNKVTNRWRNHNNKPTKISELTKNHRAERTINNKTSCA